MKKKLFFLDPKHPHYEAAKRATKHVYKVDPDMTCEGGSIPVTLTLQQATGKNVLLLPVGAADDGAHSQNEKLDIRNYIEGVSPYFLSKYSSIWFKKSLFFFRRRNYLVHTSTKSVSLIEMCYRIHVT